MKSHQTMLEVEPSTTPADEVVLLDEQGRPNGSADRVAVHTTRTPLHLAFSTYLFNSHGEVLVTRRALGKLTWPGVWTNSCCGHPRPGEQIEDAVRRRIREELGLVVGPVRPLLPEFRYRAVDASGIVENEFCPVFAAFVGDDNPVPDPDEVAEFAWVPWEDLVTAISATPHVYSPWAALQIPQIVSRHPDAAWSWRGPVVDAEEAVHDVDRLLTEELTRLGREWEGFVEDGEAEVLGRALPAWTELLLVGRGKRLRVQLAYWGFIAAGGVHGSSAYRHVIRAAAALETLHLFALIHDDVMDDSDVRRGRPSAHVEAATWHAEADGLGDRAAFGRNIAILLGDFAHTVADRMVVELPRALQDLWYELCLELISGQREDLTGCAAGRRDRAHAEHVARMKSGRYTVTRPLQIGATAAGASSSAVAALMEFGDLLGEAFALRDDQLGVWGDSEVMGKPVGDDLLEAKATVLLSMAQTMLDGRGRALLARVGTDDFTSADAADLAARMRAAGVEAAIEELITDAVRRALDLLGEQDVTAAGRAGLEDTARAVAWRKR